MSERSHESAAYRQAGVDYDILDTAKRFVGTEAAATASALAEPGWSGVERSRGDTAYVFERDGDRFATVLECLGTKSLLAREVAEQTGLGGFESIGYDAVAAVVNDLICVGALPLVVNAYFATGDVAWYGDEERLRALVHGWRRACEDSGCIWGGGESPSLKGLVSDQDIELAGSAVGTIRDRPILGEELAAGDQCILIESSGLHANGASLARLVAGNAPDGYRTALPSGEGVGAALLRPSRLYVQFVRRLLDEGVTPTYISHITGHGFRKVMRASKDLTYRLSDLPEVPEVLAYLVDAAGMDAQEAYGTLNMGAGLAVFVRPALADRVIDIAAEQGLDATVAGGVEDGPRQVVLEPIGVTFGTEELSLS